MTTRNAFIIMMILICSCFVANADAIVLPNPTTGEVGFWLTRSDMEAATFALLRVPVLEKEIKEMLELRENDLKLYADLLADYNRREREIILYKKGFYFFLVAAAVGTVGGFVLGALIK